MYLPLNKLFQFVLAIASKHNIDESHSLGHSMRVFQFAEQIAREEMLFLRKNEGPTASGIANLVEQHPVIQAASILHDTCDKKYRNEGEGLLEVRNLLTPIMPIDQVTATLGIIEHMSYSKVKKNGMPNLGEFQTAFNIVREADLMDAYDFDRSMIYHMHRGGSSVEESYINAHNLFETRVLKHAQDGLLSTQYAIRHHQPFSQNAIARMHHWQNVLRQN